MTLKISTGHAKHVLGIGSVRKAYTGGRIEVRSAPVPATVDAAATGTLLYSIVNNAAVAKAKQKIRFTPTPGSANAAIWSIILNGITFSFTDDGSPSQAEICTGLYNLIRAGIRTTAITTPAGAIVIPDVDGAFVLTDNATSLDFESSVFGVPFEYSASVSGAGAGTGSWATAVQAEDAYGLQFEVPSDITAGELELLAGKTWTGKAVDGGTPAYFRMVQDSDDGSSSSSAIRSQGSVSTAPGADMVISNPTVALNQTVTIDNGKFRFPLT